MNRYERIVGMLTKITGTAANFVLFLTMAIVSLSVLMRIFLHSPIAGLTDIVGMFNALAVAFAVSVTEKHDKHIRVDFVCEYLPPRIAKIINLFMRLLAILVISLISYRFLLYGFSTYGYGSKTWIMAIPHWPVVLCIFVGFVVFLITTIFNLLSALGNWKGAK